MFAARCAVVIAEEVLAQGDPPGPDGVPLPTVDQGAAMELVGAAAEVVARWQSDCREGAALVRELVAGGEFGAEEILDEAVNAAALTGLLALQEARTIADPSMAAELCLSAVPHFTLAVALASADVY
ncbi:hypothetical protein [Streptomyces sp. NPDC091027]|uniref:hypothetical protein n=1 Tax=Streptomyces sp. NPDC091027 TaxID=3365971 RepID=UPI003810FA1E